MSGSSTRREEEGGSSSPVRGMSLYPPPRSTRHTARRRRGGMIAAVAAGAAALLVGGVLVVLALRPDPQETPAESASVPDSFAGTWQGKMIQEDEAGEHVTDWDARVRLETGEERGSSEWYTLECRGSLTLQERGESRLVFDYVETYDAEDRCVDESRLVLTTGGADGTLDARWEATSHDGTTMISTGTLS
ncbi:hypothetical protein [Nocardiopsis halophila]|uniref:hypothetical protein n=1 Tax=Nocardiopsis halophila TaxID=141692 RepID=UPI000347A72B|nr:hypothetical protein [Nocardiopsis halophila]